MKLWQIATVVVAGLIIGEVHPGLLTQTFAWATLYLFLPALIFEAAWNLDFALMRRAWRPILLLAVPGVAITAALVALVVHRFGAVGAGTAIVLGAILSATDPVAIVALFRRLPVPAALKTIVESESLLNDAIAVVLYRAALAAIVGTASAPQIGRITLEALLGSAGGIAIGAIAGIGCAYVLRKHSGAPLQGLVTVIGAYGTYALADRIGCSGIFAVIACAIALRERERSAIGASVADAVEWGWDRAATVANACLFFLVGTAVESGHLWSERAFLGIVLVAVIVARFVLAYGVLALLPRMLRSWKTLVRFAGVRGALSLALALALPASVPERSLVVDATFVVVIATLLMGSLTLERRVGALDLGDHR
ncbi:MAG: cation:proton antiporter [Vulcanimicrobiaceae bacterium]